MKVAIECQSPLLQKSLELFLSAYLASKKQCDIIVRDEPCVGEDERCFYIAANDEADLKKPFSKAQLILALEKRLKASNVQPGTSQNETLDFSILEARIEQLTQEYKANIIHAVKAFYEK